MKVSGELSESYNAGVAVYRFKTRQIEECLNCTLPECTGCYEGESPEAAQRRRDRYKERRKNAKH